MRIAKSGSRASQIGEFTSSQAAVGGPARALAVAVARERESLVLPGIIVGLLGYAVGTYLGLAVASTVRALGAG